MSSGKSNETVVHEVEKLRVTSDGNKFYLYYLDDKWEKVMNFKDKKSALKYFKNEFAEISV